jgi:uncharacterized integral membrane protein
MAYQYRRRRPSIIRNFWVYRRLIGSAILMGLMLWFIWANDAAVTVAFPFRLGSYNSSLGIVILLSAMFGSLITLLIMTVVRALKRLRVPQQQSSTPPSRASNYLDEDRPPPDYASKTTEGFSNAPWSG